MGLPKSNKTERVPSLEEGLRLYNIGEIDAARSLLEVLLKHEPLNIDGLVVLGTCYWRLSLLDKAQAKLEEALAAQPNNITALRILGLVMYSLAKLEEAKEFLDR